MGNQKSKITITNASGDNISVSILENLSFENSKGITISSKSYGASNLVYITNNEARIEKKINLSNGERYKYEKILGNVAHLTAVDSKGEIICGLLQIHMGRSYVITTDRKIVEQTKRN